MVVPGPEEFAIKATVIAAMVLIAFPIHFTLTPIPPLGGSKVLFAFLDPRTVWRVRPVLEQCGLVILLGAMLLPIFGGRTLADLVFGNLLHPLFHLLTGL